ncbi:MAG: OsmC family protein [Ardenticatenaceae bacterium]
MPSEKHVTLEWREGQLFETMAQSGALIRFGDAPTYTGQDAGASPMEVLLMALAACSAMDILSILQKQRQKITGFQIKVDGLRRDEHPKIYTDITATYIVTGYNVERAGVARAVELSVTKYCSVSAMLAQSAPIHTRIEVHEAGSEPA